MVLPNAWDCMSARVFEGCGFRAIATTSAGVAWAMGSPDGEGLGRGEMAEAVARVAGSVSVPVTADAEAGYGPSPEDAAETARAMIRAGAVGVNLEDAADPTPPGPGGHAAGWVPRSRTSTRSWRRSGPSSPPGGSLACRWW